VKVYINTHEVNIFAGANAGDAVLSYSERLYEEVKAGRLMILDCFGNETEPDGKVTEGQEFMLIERPS